MIVAVAVAAIMIWGMMVVSMVFHFHFLCKFVYYIDTICLIQTHRSITLSYIVRYKYYVYMNNTPT